MATTAGALATQLALQVRDPDGTAHTAAQLIDTLSRCQRVVNAWTRAVIATPTLALSTSVPQALYFMTTNATLQALVRVERIRYYGRELDMVDWHQLVHIDPGWIRAQGSAPKNWAMIGRTLLVITPTPTVSATSTGVSVAISGPKLVGALAVAGDVPELPDHHMPTVLRLAEQLILLRQRLLQSVKPAVERFQIALPSGRLL